ncbi:MAG: CrcB family protein [Myxococcota bacterium]
MTEFLLWQSVSLGGALGALARAACLRAIAASSGTSDDEILLSQRRGIRLANTLGCLALGWLSQGETETWPEGLRAALIVGVCGSLTTFSTLCAQLIQTLRGPGGIRSVAWELLLSLGFGYAALQLGFALG